MGGQAGREREGERVGGIITVCDAIRGREGEEGGDCTEEITQS